jgi:hypothetical protein
MKIKSISRVLSCAAVWLLLAGFLSPHDAVALDLLSNKNANGRYFHDQSGKAVYLVGSHTWNNFLDGAWAEGRFTNLDTFDYEAYLLWMQGLKHNFIRLWTPENTRDFECTPSVCTPLELPVSPTLYLRDKACKMNCTGRDGLRKFNLLQFNDEYFNRLHARVVAAGEKGIYVSIMLFDASGLGVYDLSDGRRWWYGHAYNEGNNIYGINGGDTHGLLCQTGSNSMITALQEAYVFKVIDKLKDLNNVLYEINNEGIGDGHALNSTQWQWNMIAFIKNTEAAIPNAKRHPVRMTGFANGYGNEPLDGSDADWISPRHLEDINHDYEDDPPQATGDKVVILDTDHLYNNLDSYDWQSNPPDPDLDNRARRTWVWKSFTRGYNPIYMDQMYLPPTDFGGASISQAVGSSPPIEHSPHADDVRKAMGHTRSYADRMNLIEMTPQRALSSTDYALAKLGQEYLIYQPILGEFTVVFANYSVEYSVEWFNPRTGEIISDDNRVVDHGATFSSPFSKPEDTDAVLYLKRVP